MHKTNRREFLKRLMVSGAVVAAGASVANADAGIKSGKSKSKETLYKRNATWEFYYKQAK